jgi:hypothetical protein
MILDRLLSCTATEYIWEFCADNGGGSEKAEGRSQRCSHLRCEFCAFRLLTSPSHLVTSMVYAILPPSANE